MSTRVNAHGPPHGQARDSSGGARRRRLFVVFSLLVCGLAAADDNDDVPFGVEEGSMGLDASEPDDADEFDYDAGTCPRVFFKILSPPCPHPGKCRRGVVAQQVFGSPLLRTLQAFVFQTLRRTESSAPSYVRATTLL